MRIDCPKCDHALSVDVIAAVGNEQKFVYRVHPLEGQMMQCQAIGGQLVELDKLFKAIAREDGGKVRSYLHHVETHDDGSFSFHIAILPVRKAQP